MGRFPQADLLRLVERKKVLPTDHYWKRGMAEWRSVAELIPVLKASRRQVVDLCLDGQSKVISDL